MSTKIFINLLLFIGLALSSCDVSTYFCNLAGITCPSSSNTITLNGVVYSAAHFGVISFNDLTITHGDTQDRIAVRNNFNGFNGISVADLQDGDREFSLVVGQNLNWNDNGAVTGNIFVGNQVSATYPSSLSGSITLGCATAGCLDAAFDSIQTYWQQFSSNIALQTANVDISIGQDGIATLNCQAAASLYVARIAPESFNSIVGYSVAGSCSGSASWIFNIIGSGDVYFGGNPIQASGSVLFNIAPSSKVTVASNVNGHILAPYSNVNMIGGVITGQVIVGNFSNIIQVNKPTCPPSTSGSASSSSGSASSGSAASSSGSDSASSSSSDSASASSSSSTSDSSASASSSSSSSSGSETGLTTSTIIEGTDINSGVIGATNNENSSAFSISSSIILAVAMIALLYI